MATAVALTNLLCAAALLRWRLWRTLPWALTYFVITGIATVFYRPLDRAWLADWWWIGVPVLALRTAAVIEAVALMLKDASREALAGVGIAATAVLLLCGTLGDGGSRIAYWHVRDAVQVALVAALAIPLLAGICGLLPISRWQHGAGLLLICGVMVPSSLVRLAGFLQLGEMLPVLTGWTYAAVAVANVVWAVSAPRCLCLGENKAWNDQKL